MGIIDKTRKYRRVIDWVGIVISVAMIFIVTSITTKIILGALAVLSIAFIVFKMDERIERMILRRMVSRGTKTS